MRPTTARQIGLWVARGRCRPGRMCLPLLLAGPLLLALLAGLALPAWAQPSHRSDSTSPVDVRALPRGTTTTPCGTPNSQAGWSRRQSDGTDKDLQLRFERISLEQGLSESSVYAILQDQQGFLWFGTQEGLNKYDGYNFTVYKPIPGQNSLAESFVRALYQDEAGVLWVGTDGGGLDRLNRDTNHFIHYQFDPNDSHSLSSNAVRSIAPGQGGQLWIATYGGGLNRFDPQTQQFQHYHHRRGNPHSLSSDFVWTVYQDREGFIWAGTEAGLDRLDPNTGQFARYQHDPQNPHSLSGHIVRAIYQDREGTLWVGTDNGLNRFDPQTEGFTRYQTIPGSADSLSANPVRAIYQDDQGALWIGTEGGLNRLDRNGQRFTRYLNNPNDPHSPSADFVRTIYQDAEGTLWVGTYGAGLNKAHTAAASFQHYHNDPTDPDSLSSNQLWSIYQDHRGVLWVGLAGAGLDRLNPGSDKFIHYRPNPNDPQGLSDGDVRAIHEDREGRLWLGTENGLNCLDANREHLVRYFHDPNEPNSLSHNNIRTIYEDSQGRLWIGTYGGGLDQFDPGTGRFVHYTSGGGPTRLNSAFIWSIIEDRDGTLWIGTGGGGLDRLDPKQRQVTHYFSDPDNPHSLSHNTVLSLHLDREGTLWVGTFGGGLNRFDREGKNFRAYREQDGLPNEVIYGILEDDQGNLWLSTNQGLSRFDPRSETFRTYDVDDGVQSNEFNAGAYHKNDMGQLFFGGINGFNAFYPEDIEDNGYIPPVVLTSLTQGRENIVPQAAIESVGAITLDWPNNYVEFEFAALSYVQPSKNAYAYMLEGFDSDWVYTGPRRFGRYTNLSAGTYTLRVKGSNNDGIWNEQGTAVKVTVVPPFWGTLWFRGGLVLLLAGVAIAGYRLRVRSVETRSKELALLVEERTQALAQRTHEIEQSREELEALYRADAELYRYLDLDQVLQALVDTAVEILQADKGALLVWDEGRERLIPHATRGLHPETAARISLGPNEGIAGRVAVSGEMIIVPDTRRDPRVSKAIIEAEGIRSFMQVPIKIGGETFGVFSADYVQTHAFDEREQRLLVALAQRAALAIENAQLYEQAQELAAMRERSRLARDLHDAVTQTLFSASLIAEVVPTLWESDPEEGRQLLEELRQLSRGALAEMRTLLLELRPAALTETPLGDLLRQLTEAASGREGLPIIVTVDGDCILPPDIHVTLYRIAQEALNNALKHAQANQLSLYLSRTYVDGQERVELRIRDDGRGFETATTSADGLGLGIMEERAQTIGADLQIKSQPGQGTEVVLIWPEELRQKGPAPAKVI